MADKSKSKVKLSDFPKTYWVAIFYEFFERGSYYGLMSFLSVYLEDQLDFSKTDIGIMKSTIQPLIYFLPIVMGAIADRLGYRKMLFFAFALLGGGYFAISQTTGYTEVFIALVIMGIGAGTFKPVISGTLAKVTNEKTSDVGFAMFYWTINFGAFLFPFFLVPALKEIHGGNLSDPNVTGGYVILASALFTTAMIIPTIFLYKEPPIEEVEDESILKVILGVLQKIWNLFLDWRFSLFIFIYSWFWVLYFQMFDSVLWFFNFFIDQTPMTNFVHEWFGIENFVMGAEKLTALNALTIIILQVLITFLVKDRKAINTIVVGVGIGSLGIFILAFSGGVWGFMLGIVVFSLGEMTAHPKYISYLAMIAPADKKATYTGAGFLYGFFGSAIAGYLGAKLYDSMLDNPMITFIKQQIVEKGSSIQLASDATIKEAMKAANQIGIEKSDIIAQANPTDFWLVFVGIGVFTIISLVVYDKLIGTRDASDLK